MMYLQQFFSFLYSQIFQVTAIIQAFQIFVILLVIHIFRSRLIPLLRKISH